MIARDIDAAREALEDYARIHAGQGEPQVYPTAPGRWRNFYENVADVLTKGAEPAVKLDEMRRLMAVIDAVFESSRTGREAPPEVR